MSDSRKFSFSVPSESGFPNRYDWETTEDSCETAAIVGAYRISGESTYDFFAGFRPRTQATSISLSRPTRKYGLSPNSDAHRTAFTTRPALDKIFEIASVFDRESDDRINHEVTTPRSRCPRSTGSSGFGVGPLAYSTEFTVGTSPVWFS